MKKKTLTLMTFVFVLLASLVFAKTNDELLGNVDLLNMQELNKEIDFEIQQTLPRSSRNGNWLQEDPLGYLSITEIKDIRDILIDIIESKSVNLKHMSDRTQFNVMSYVIDMNDKELFAKLLGMGFNYNIEERLQDGRYSNIFTQVVLSRNEDVLNYLYMSLPENVLEEKMYETLQGFIKTDYNSQNLSDNWYSMINNKYSRTPATFEDLKHAVLYGKKEGAEELKIAYNSIPKDERVKELYKALLSLIYYKKDSK